MSTSTQSSVPTKKGKISVYFLAAPEDEEQTKAVKKYLSPVVRSSEIPIEILSDFEIPPGQDINEYKLQLYDADIVLAFISADFINDDQTYIRTQKVIERYNNNETVMLPILVRNCMWKSTPFVNLPLLPKNTQPLNNKQFWNSEDDALTSVVNDIYASINEFSYEDVVEESAEADISEMTDTNMVESMEEQTVSEITKEVEASEAIIEEAKSEITPEVEEMEPVVQDAIEEIEPQDVVDKDASGLAEQLEEISEPEPIEEPSVVPEVKKIEPEPTKTKVKGEGNIDLQVDWRKKYYRRVLWKRALAFILDQVLTYVPLFIIGMLIGMEVFDVNLESDTMSTQDWLGLFISPLILYFVVCAIVESSKYKGTFGKLIMRMEITDRQGNRIGFVRAFFRNILRFITGYLFIFIIPFIIQFFTYRKYKKLFHDQISYTVVGERLKK